MTELLCAIALAGTAVAFVALVVLHVLPTGLSVVRDPVSRYGLTRYRAAYAIAAASAGIAGIAVAALLWLVVHAIAAAVLLLVFAVARLLIPRFPMDQPGTARSRTGRVHSWLAVAAFAGATAAAFVASPACAAAGFTELAALSTVAGVAMALGSVLVIAGASGSVRRIFGLAERLIYLGFIGWFACVAVAFLAR